MKNDILYRFVLCFFVFFAWSTQAEVQGVNHVGLTVTKLNESENFFIQHAGFRLLGRDNSYPSTFLSNDEVMITLWRVSNTDSHVSFDRKNNVGLHHLAFNVDSFESLEQLHKSLKKDPLVKIEFAPELLGRGPAKHMMVYEPSGNRIEFIHRPGR